MELSVLLPSQSVSSLVFICFFFSLFCFLQYLQIIFIFSAVVESVEDLWVHSSELFVYIVSVYYTDHIWKDTQIKMV